MTHLVMLVIFHVNVITCQIFNFPHMLINIICKNIVNFFQKFEVGYIQTCRPLESNTM
jgi:hypothetical protein